MNIQSIPSTSLYVPPQQDDYSDQSDGSGNEVASRDSGKNREIRFESDPMRATQHDASQHAYGSHGSHGSHGAQGSRGIDFLDKPFTDQSNAVNNPSEISPSSDLSLSDQIHVFADLLQDLMTLLTGMLGSNQSSSNDSGSHSSDASEFLSPVTSSYSEATEPTVPAGTAASNEPAATSPSTSSAEVLSGAEHMPTISEFKTIDPGEGPDLVKDANGKFVFNEIVDDSFLPEDVQQGMREAVEANKDLSFFQDNFNNEQDMYQYLVHMANLESGGGASLENAQDAAGSGTGGSAGYMHLHMNYGLAENSFGGAPLNTEGWSQEEVLGDYSKYTELTMKHIDGAYQSVGGNENNEATEQAMALWWTGNDSAAAGAYYMEALSGGTGVNHNTGSAYM